MKAINLFGRSIPIVAVFLVALAIPATALLATYVTTSGTATVSQSVTLIGIDSEYQHAATTTLVNPTTATWSLDAVGSYTQDVGLELSNNAEVTATTNVVSATSTNPGGTYASCSDVGVSIYSDFNTGTKQCAGDVISGACSGDSVSANGVTVAAGSSKWVCIRHVWNIAATPGEYGFTDSVNPAA